MCERIDKLVDSLFLHLDIIESDAQIGCQVQFTCQVAKDTLEESVDGLHAEVAVVMKQLMKRFTGLFADL